MTKCTSKNWTSFDYFRVDFLPIDIPKSIYKSRYPGVFMQDDLIRSTLKEPIFLAVFGYVELEDAVNREEVAAVTGVDQTLTDAVLEELAEMGFIWDQATFGQSLRPWLERAPGTRIPPTVQLSTHEPEISEIAAKPASPHTVYWHLDADGNVLYVGISKRSKQRQEQHRKTATWWNQIAKIEACGAASRHEALDIELRMLLDHRPPFNKSYDAHRMDRVLQKEQRGAQ